MDFLCLEFLPPRLARKMFTSFCRCGDGEETDKPERQKFGRMARTKL
jgi:hypothetical protein